MSHVAASPVEIDPDSEPFFRGLERGELLIQRCDECGCPQFPPRVLCSHCGSRQLSWTQAAGTGTVYSFTTCHRAGAPELAGTVPFTVALVDLDDGVRMLGQLEVDSVHAAIGMQVTISIVAGDGAPRLTFKPFRRRE